MIESSQHIRQLSKVGRIGLLIEAGKTAGNEYLTCFDLTEDRPQRVERPLLRRLDENRICTEIEHELPIALDLAAHSHNGISGDREDPDRHPVVRGEIPVRQIARCNSDLMPGGGQPFRNLAHDLLHPATAWMVEFTAEQKSHRAP